MSPAVFTCHLTFDVLRCNAVIKSEKNVVAISLEFSSDLAKSVTILKLQLFRAWENLRGKVVQKAESEKTYSKREVKRSLRILVVLNIQLTRDRAQVDRQ